VKRHDILEEDPEWYEVDRTVKTSVVRNKHIISGMKIPMLINKLFLQASYLGFLMAYRRVIVVGI
jgi:hypothetical protein